MEAYRELSEIHNDGWGAGLLSSGDDANARHIGGVPSAETDVRLYKSTVAARHDPIFSELAQEGSRGALWHLRLASSRLPVILENQQPFYANGITFTHNGDISDESGRNIVANRDFPVDRNIVLSTGGRSDSAIFFAVILEYIGFGFPLDESVAQAVRELRETYPKSSYNCMLQSNDEFVVLRAAGREQTSERIIEIYSEYGRGEQAHNYRSVGYKDILSSDGTPVGVVAGSTGFPQEENSGWRTLDNNQMIVASNRNGSYRIRSI